MRICIINRINDNSEKALIAGLHKSKHEIFLIGETVDLSLKEFEAQGIPVSYLNVRYRFDLKAYSFLKKFFTENNFDLIYSPAARTLTPVLFATAGLKVKIITYRGTLARLSKFNPVDLLSHLNPRVNAIICNSQAVKNKLFGFGVKKDKLHVVYKGHNLKWYQQESAGEYYDLNIPDGRFIIGSVANFRKGKGGKILIQAFQKLLKKNLPVHLVLVGSIEGQEIKNLIHEYSLSEYITCTGYKNNASCWIPHFNLSVMPSVKNESFSRTIVESMAQKVPVIVTDVGGMPELVQHKKNGLVVQAGEIDALAEAMSFAYQNQKTMQSFAEHAVEEFVKRFSVEKYVNETERVFRGASLSLD